MLFRELDCISSDIPITKLQRRRLRKMATSFLAPKRVVRALLDSQPTRHLSRSVASTSLANSETPAHTQSFSDHSSASINYPKPDSKWLSTTKQRIGKCMSFGLRPEQTRMAADILGQLARDWRELVAGSEGFLTSYDRRGLFRHNVAWGEMVCPKLQDTEYGR